MFTKLKNIFLASSFVFGSFANAQQANIGLEAEVRLNGMQRNFNLETGKERHYGDVCRLSFEETIGNSFLFRVNVGMTSPKSLSGTSQHMKVKFTAKDTLSGVGSEQYYERNDPYSTIKIFNHKIVIKLNKDNTPVSFKLTSENGIDQVICEGLSEAGI